MGRVLAMSGGTGVTTASIHPRDQQLRPIWEKVREGVRLTRDDGLTMFASPDVITLGKMAHVVQQQKSGDAVYFVVNQKIEPTNVCVLSCKFCDFATKTGRPDAYEMTIGEILEKITPDVHEVHITGGLHPTWEWEYYLDILRQIRGKFPHVDIKAFTAVEIDFFHKKFRIPIVDVLRQLKEAGLNTMPGGGAEVFSERVRRLLFNQKIGAKTWLEIHRTAHAMGIPSNSTILYGHIETVGERVDHLLSLRSLQDETGGFLSFIPLAFQPGQTGIKPAGRFTSAIDDLKMIAISRLMLDNIPHIKAYWVMLTEEVASVALNFGADDMDGTVRGEKIAHDAGAVSPMTLAKEQIVRIVRDAGKIPVERDAFYNPLRVHTERVLGKIPYLNSVPFYVPLEKRQFRILPVTPRRMGRLARQGEIDAGLFSLVDFLELRDELEPLPYCIATRDQVRSVMLFSNYGWRQLSGKVIGITDDTATSVKLLKILLEKKYDVRATFQRMHAGVNAYEMYDALLLIGDEALRANKFGIGKFELVYDLATEWYDWQRMPFVFAIWGVRKDMTDDRKRELQELISDALARGESNLESISREHARRLHITADEAVRYLEGFNYRMGEREQKAVEKFESLLREIEIESHRDSPETAG